MPFLNGDYVDFPDRSTLIALSALAESDLDGLQHVLGHPELRDGIANANVAFARLLVLERSRPAAVVAIQALPWVRDGITHTPTGGSLSHQSDMAKHEHVAVVELADAAQYAIKTLEALLEQPWVLDGFIWRELTVVQTLTGIGSRDDDAAARIVGMPFLASTDYSERDEFRKDSQILEMLRELVYSKPSALQQLLSSPELSGGITNDDTTTLRLLTLKHLNPEAFLALAALPWMQDGVDSSDRRGISAMRSLALLSDQTFRLLVTRSWVRDGLTVDESSMVYWLSISAPSLEGGEGGALQAIDRQVTLPLAGEVRFLVIWPTGEVSDPQGSRTLDLLEYAVRAQEEFIGIPYPNPYAVLLIVDKDEHSAGSAGPGRIITIDPPYSDSVRVIAHEAAHTYWHTFSQWITEGAAEFMASITERARTGEPLPEPVESCSQFNSLADLDRLAPTDYCRYPLGESMFLDLYRGLGDEAFRRGFANLYLLWRDFALLDECTGDDFIACYFKAAFVTDANPRDAAIAEEIIDRRYYGAS